MTSPSHTIRLVSRTMVKPSPTPQLLEGKHCPLNPWDLSMISLTYIEWGLVFSSLPPSLPPTQIIDRLKNSLSAALFHFYPLAGRLATETYKDGLSISIDCNAEGAEFIHAVADKLTVAEVLANNDNYRAIIQSLLPFYGAINYDGHFLPLLAVQVTELTDGIFLSCCVNHCVVDGTAFWNFFSSWAEICRRNDIIEGSKTTISHPPIHKRWFLNGTETPYKLPFVHPDEFIRRFSPNPKLRMRIFHFSSETIAKLKSQANSELRTNKISSFQALSSLMWKSITRARAPLPNQITSCRMASDERLKLVPPLGADYFGNSVIIMNISARVEDLLANGIGCGAQLLNEKVRAHGDSEIREQTRARMEAPVFAGTTHDPLRVCMLSSPRYPVYECDFGWGKPEAIRTGCMFGSDGVVAAFPAREGGGSVELEVYLKPETMKALEYDEEFMGAVSQ